MRLKLSESPVFKAMKEAGETRGNPFVESFTYPGNKKRIFVALFGVTGILTTIWYTAFFSSLSFLRGPDAGGRAAGRDDPADRRARSAMAFYVVVGKWSDRIGRKKPIVIGALATLVLLFPVFWGMGCARQSGPCAAPRKRRWSSAGRPATPIPSPNCPGNGHAAGCWRT